ncbi:hypothetical protein PIB30_003735 [Stylosanthes scabra]|uniref:Uncharacterized protein n=1 Tax=Stylosanthes scabra TaxID=79078 RepID=A0ABU6Q3C1_9FABA|nr:hypothetical protein [Stylosanthes scabra]
MSFKASLPVSQTECKLFQEGSGSIRRRLSSMSLRIQPSSSPAVVSSWSLPRSKSLLSVGNYAGTSLRKWWEWGWAWILSRKPVFARDLEMNEQETKILSSHDKGTWRHVLYKLRSDIRRFVASVSDPVGLPQTDRSHHHSVATSANPTIQPS